MSSTYLFYYKFDIAINYAKYLSYEESKLAEIYKLKGEYEYSRGVSSC